MNSLNKNLIKFGLILVIIITFGFLASSVITLVRSNSDQSAQVLSNHNVTVTQYRVLPDSVDPVNDPTAFITTWKTDNISSGSSNAKQITIPTTGSGYNYTVNWGDGTSDSGVTGNKTHTYANVGTYQVQITGSFPRIYVNNSGDRLKLLSVDQWGLIVWSSMAKAFYGASNLAILANDVPNLSNVTDMSSMFALNQSSTAWSSSIGNWNTSHVTNMASLFSRATNFNKNISAWNTSNVTDTNGMFYLDTAFNQPLNNWNVARVTNMNGMFLQASSFNQPLSSWNVSNVTDFGNMFYLAASFNQPLQTWNVRNAVDMRSMLSGTSFSNANYDALLAAWSALPLHSGVNFAAANTKFCSSATQRASIVRNHGWVIIDGGSGCNSSDHTAPTVTNAVINGNILTITFSETLSNGIVPDPNSFFIGYSGRSIGVQSSSISGSSLVLTLSESVAEGVSVSMNYSPTNHDQLQDTAGNQVAFFNRNVTNTTNAGGTDTNPTSGSSGGGGGGGSSGGGGGGGGGGTPTTQTPSPTSTPTYSSNPTTQQLLLIIQQLQAQLAALLAARGITTGTSAAYYRDLTYGDTGQDVKTLQTFLISKGFLAIPLSSAQGDFGPLTQAALAHYQAAHGISPAVGYFGPITRSYIISHP